MSQISKYLYEPNLLIPWREPTGPVEVAWEKPITKGLSSYIGLFNGGIQDLVGRMWNDTANTVDVSVVPPKIIGNDGGGRAVEITPFYVSEDAVTLFGVFEKTSATETWSGIFAYYETYGSAHRFEIGWSGSKIYLQASNGSWARFSPIVPVNDTKIVVVATRDAAKQIKIYYRDKNGVQYGEIDDTASSTTSMTVKKAMIQAAGTTAGGRAWRGALYSGGIFNRVLSVEECWAIVNDPCHFVKSAHNSAIQFNVAAPAGTIAPQHYHHRHHNRAG